MATSSSYYCLSSHKLRARKCLKLIEVAMFLECAAENFPLECGKEQDIVFCFVGAREGAFTGRNTSKYCCIVQNKKTKQVLLLYEYYCLLLYCCTKYGTEYFTYKSTFFFLVSISERRRDTFWFGNPVAGRGRTKKGPLSVNIPRETLAGCSLCKKVFEACML